MFKTTKIFSIAIFPRKKSCLHLESWRIKKHLGQIEYSRNAEQPSNLCCCFLVLFFNALRKEFVQLNGLNLSYSLCFKKTMLIIRIITEVFRYMMQAAKFTVLLLILDCKRSLEIIRLGLKKKKNLNKTTQQSIICLLAGYRNSFPWTATWTDRPFCFTSTEARLLIRNGKRGELGAEEDEKVMARPRIPPEKDRRDREPPPLRTMEVLRCVPSPALRSD